MMQTTTSSKFCRSEGAALVVTLIVMVVLAVVAVAFMQNTSLDRSSARSIANVYRAQLAAEAGLARFLAEMSDAVALGDFTVLELTDPANESRRYTAIVRFDGEGNGTGLPLSSRPADTEPVALTAPFNLAGMFGSLNAAVGAGGETTNVIAALKRYSRDASTIVDYPAAEVDDLTLSAAMVPLGEGTLAEFAYIAVDESAKLNVNLFGAEYEGKPRIKQEVEEFAGEVALADSGDHAVALEHLETFNNLPAGIRIGAVWPSLYPDFDERRGKNQFYSGHRGEVLDTIPFGYLDDALTEWTEIADGGQPKFDINSLVLEDDEADARPAHERIADIINRNLPDWHKRDPALLESELKPDNNELRYIRRIAAAIADYIDDDSEITLLEDGEPAGKEAVAYPFKIIERYDWVGAVLDTTGEIPVWNLTVLHKVFVELWNPHNVPVSGTFEMSLRSFRELGHPEPSDNPFTIPELRGSIQVALRPNEIDVFELAGQTVTAIAFGENVTSKPIRGDFTSSQTGEDAENKYHTRYSASWNGQVYSYTPNELPTFAEFGPGLVKPALAISNSPTSARPSFQGNIPLSNAGGGGRRAVGDPRHLPISNYTWDNFSYVNASLRFKGASQYAVGANQTQRFDETWNRRDPLRAALPTGSRPTATQNPTAVASTYNEATDGLNAVAFIRNGPMETIAELGHIYDAAHLDDSGRSTQGGTPRSWFSSGGGRTLRIGQPEFDYPSYNLAGQRSSSLLDLFTTSMGKGDLGERTSGINMNTAPEEVLTSFFYNMAPRSDEGMGSVGAPPRLSLEGARNVARSVIENRPYFTAADFHKFTGALHLNANFAPEVGIMPDGSLRILDRGREEIFRRAYNFIDTKSGAFKFYGVGRALAPDGKVVSEAALEAQVELRAEADAEGNVRLRPVVTQKKFL